MRLLLEQPVRMLAETRGVDALAAEVDWLTKCVWGITPAGDVCVDFDITLQSKVYEAVLTYPSLFPDAPACVRPRKPDDVWSAHQYPASGALCLEWGPDNWHQTVTGAELIRSTRRLLEFEKDETASGVEAPSRHELTLGQRLRAEIRRFVVTTELLPAISATTSETPIPLTVTTSSRFAELVAVVTKVGAEEESRLGGLPPELTDPDIGAVFARAGWLVQCGEWESLPKPASKQSDVREFLKGKGKWPWTNDEEQNGFLLLVDDDCGIRPIAVGSEDKAYEYRVVYGSTIDTGRQPEKHKSLEDKLVAIVGLGSVGSKVAVSLARAGVRRFLLIDDDILLPANLTRNQLDWLSVGYDKVDGVRGAIRLVRPDADIQVRSFRFAGQESSARNGTILEQVAACDLVIDATASPRVFSSVAAICSRRRIAFVWGEVFSGGIGGLMARSVPERDADPLTVRASINEYLATLPEAPFRRSGGYDVDVGGDILVAGDAEVSLLAASVAQFSIDTLIVDGTPKFPVAAYLFGYQKAWIFEGPFDTRAIACPAALPAGPAGDNETNANALRELISVFGDEEC